MFLRILQLNAVFLHNLQLCSNFSNLRCCFWAICGFRISFPSVGSFTLCRVVFVKSQNAFCGNRAKAGARVKYRFHLCGALPNNNGSAALPSNATLVAVSPFAGMVIGKFPAICKKTFSKLVFNKKPSAEKLLKRYLYVGNKKNVSAKDTFCFVENNGSAALPGNAILVAVSRFLCWKTALSFLFRRKSPTCRPFQRRSRRRDLPQHVPLF